MAPHRPAPKSYRQPRERWLTRREVARLLRASPPKLRRFILISVYTGTRAGAILALRWCPSIGSGWVDLDRGLMHRRGAAERETAKRRGTCRLPRQLLGHLRRWERAGGDRIVGYASHRSAHKAWHRACADAGIQGAQPHDLKHTAVTWAFQAGISLEDAADYFSTNSQTLERVYRAHSPEHQARAIRAIELGGRGETG